jgi:mannose-6-phosphate isomerase-like protein (cupin superfamily)
MPLLKLKENKFPEWSEVKSISHHLLRSGSSVEIQKEYPSITVFIISGECNIKDKGLEKTLSENDSFYPGTETTITSLNKDSEIVIIEGNWGVETGSSAVFRMSAASTPRNTGDPADYPRTNDFDNHYHDFDEYWIILKGSGVAVSEGIKYTFSAGDIIATRMGDHHDLPEIYEDIVGIYFETTLKGKKRTGHLWSHTHGVHDLSERKDLI